jgi:iron-sulfur cluster assembly protein
MALKVSDAAVKQVKELKQAQNLGDDVFLRMGVKSGGCSGMSYALEFDSELGPEDREFQIDGVRIVFIAIDDESLTGAGVPYADNDPYREDGGEA